VARDLHRDSLRDASTHHVADCRAAEVVEEFLGHLPPLVTLVDTDAIELATAILTAAGAVVRSCARASEALEVLRDWRPDVLVSDLEMPGEDGLSLIRKVRALAAEAGGTTPALALTAYGRLKDGMRSLAAGYSMHISKPVDPAELTAIVASVARRSPPAATS
jgi:CheY-like chemotaxis protein